MISINELLDETLDVTTVKYNTELLDHEKSILDLKRWRILGITPAKKKQKGSVLVMKHRTKEKYCTQYLHSGQYFDSLEELIEYAEKRKWTPLNINDK